MSCRSLDHSTSCKRSGVNFYLKKFLIFSLIMFRVLEKNKIPMPAKYGENLVGESPTWVSGIEYYTGVKLK